MHNESGLSAFFYTACMYISVHRCVIYILISKICFVTFQQYVAYVICLFTFWFSFQRLLGLDRECHVTLYKCSMMRVEIFEICVTKWKYQASALQLKCMSHATCDIYVGSWLWSMLASHVCRTAHKHILANYNWPL